MNREDVERLPGMSGLLDGVDHVDVHSMSGPGSVRALAASITSYRPAWMALLWRVRVWLLRALGHAGHGVPERVLLNEKTLPLSPGDKVGSFEVVRSDGETHWVIEGRENHLDGVVAIVAEPLPEEGNLFHVVTLVHYHDRAGVVYFNLIRPFHHAVVHFAMRSFFRGCEKK